MALNPSGAISLAGTTAGQSIEVELGGGGTTQISLNCTNVRTLAAVPSGQISMPTNFWGKSNAFTATISSNQSNLNLATWASANGWNGSAPATITIGSGVYIYSTCVAVAGLTTGAFPGGLTIINNGYIMGKGGNANVANQNGQPGGPALSLSRPATITNNSYIAGGGGGGGSSTLGPTYGGGGGGAGGGAGAANGPKAGGAGGGVGAAGCSGSGVAGLGWYLSGGGGGRILPGTGGAGSTAPSLTFAGGGGAGGGGGLYGSLSGVNGAAGGGGGWGAAGGRATGSGGMPNTPSYYGGNGGSGGSAGGDGVSRPPISYLPNSATGGNAVTLNGYAVTWPATGTRYGAVS